MKLMLTLFSALAGLAGCAQMPSGPAVAVTPGPYKPFEVFAQDDELCRGWAAHSIGLPGHDDAAQAFIGSTTLGAVIGGLAGAAMGGNRGAGSGAAAGAFIGAAAGANQGNALAWNAQRRYDIAYQQCMYAKGNLVPAYGWRAPAAPPAPPAPPPAPPVPPAGH